MSWVDPLLSSQVGSSAQADNLQCMFYGADCVCRYLRLYLSLILPEDAIQLLFLELVVQLLLPFLGQESGLLPFQLGSDLLVQLP